MNDKVLEEIRGRLDCIILLSCKNNASENEKLKIASNCIGLRETARLLGKDSGNFSRQINQKEKKKNDK